MELKEKYTDVICKEIVSFVNTSDGVIVIGVKDDGTIVGVNKIDETLRKISDIIATQIESNPQAEVSTEIRFEDGKTLIIVNVSRGIKHIYCQKKYGFSSVGCTIRVGTTCREMTPEQIRIRYESKFIDSEYMLKRRASQLDLTFRELKIYYSEKDYHLDDKTSEANLNLRNQNGDYNLLAELLSDRNNIPLQYNLDMIISLGYCVKSKIATNFRRWDTERLKEHMMKGFIMDDERLKGNDDGNYWKELLDRIRDIRLSEKVMYRQVLDLYATSVDYDPKSRESIAFFKMVRNKLHYAAHGHRAAEVIYERADASLSFMGLKSF